MITKFVQTKKIAIVGDIIFDEFVYGAVKRLNPEAPVPVLTIKKREFCLGGAGNVAQNIQSLGGECTLVGRVGNEGQIQRMLDAKGIEHQLIVDQHNPTTVKTRFVANQQQLLRADDEFIHPLLDEQITEMLESVRHYDFIIVADYGKGVVDGRLMAGLRACGRKILVDPKVLSREWFHGVFLIKPNLIETEHFVKADLTVETALEKAGATLVNDYQSQFLITRGKEGMSLFQPGNTPLHFPGQEREVFDVSGAGDTVIATVGLALASGIPLEEGIVLANRAAGIVVGKFGTASVSSHELFSSVERESQKIKTPQEMAGIVDDLRKQEKKIVFTNGCFDILHVGHTTLLKQAKNFGDVLILGLNSDQSVRKLKGPERPIIKEQERADILSSLESVDYVVFFDEGDPCNLIALIKPDIHVKGGDYTPDNYDSMPEAKLVKEYGGRIELVTYIDGTSTTKIIEKIKAGSGEISDEDSPQQATGNQTHSD